MAPCYHAQDVWEQVSGGDVAGRIQASVSGGLLVQNAVELDREETRKATECTNADCAQPAARTRNVVRVQDRVPGGLLIQNAVKLEREETRRATECANADCARPAARTRNVVMITVESLGALYTDLYNPKAHTMPFVSGLFNAALPGSAFLLERIYVIVLRLEPSPGTDLHVAKI